MAGCYLTYTDSSNGTLFINWVKEDGKKLEGAYAFFAPTKPVAGFKYKKAGGREELTRNTDSERKNYFQGWCNFVKMAKEYGGDFVLLEKKAGIYLNSQGKISRAEPGEACALSEVDAVVALPENKTTFDGAKTMVFDRFVSSGVPNGGAGLTLKKG